MSDLKYIILDKIKQNIVCEKVQVNNKSHLHQHHAQSPKNNNSHFEVLKYDGISGFKSIGSVSAKKEPASLNNYSFVDSNPNNGSNYYQLKQYDFDGKSSTSKTIEVYFGFNNPFTVYPNPVKVGDDIHIKSLNFDKQLDIQLVDINQRVILKKQVTEQQGKLYLSTKGLLPGIYILKLNTGKQQFYNKVVIVPQ